MVRAMTSAMAPMPPSTSDPVIKAKPDTSIYRFDGGAGSWLGVQLLGALVTVCTLGICYPWAVVMTYRWKADHTYLNGRRLRFTGDAVSLFGLWLKWLVLIVVTLGIYGFWVYPRLIKWTVEHQDYA